MKNFRLAHKFITSVPTQRLMQLRFEDGTTKTGMAYGTEDHPNFTKLRERLEKTGYILIERSWCNGDRVKKGFKLNGFVFRKLDQFPCAAALRIRIEVKRKLKRSK